MSTWTSSMTRDERGSGICLTTRITSSTLVLIDGGSRSLRRFVARLRKRLGRYHCLARRLLRRSRRVFPLFFPTPRGGGFTGGENRSGSPPSPPRCTLSFFSSPVVGRDLAFTRPSGWV